MTQQEEELLNGLIERVNGTQLPGKDPEVERKLATTLGSNPNALYILCQTVLVQQFALENSQTQLENSQAELEDLRAQLQQAQQQPEEKHTSFLGSIIGTDKKVNPPAQQPGYAPVHDPYGNAQPQYGGGTLPSGSQPPQYTNQPYGTQPGYGYPPQGYPQQPPPPPGYGYGAPSVGGGMFGGGGGFLASAAQTAAGVVAGEVAFRAIEDIFSSGHERGFADSRPEVANNDFADNNRGNGDSFGDRLASADNYNGGISSDIEDRRGESSSFFGGGSNDNDDSSNFADDGSSDDGSSYDDSGSGGDDSGF